MNNTFGERLPYLLPVDDPDVPVLRLRHDKRLHVSPFFGLDQEYRWEFARARRGAPDPDRGLGAGAQAVRRRPRRQAPGADRRSARPHAAPLPAAPVQVIAHIHCQALRLLAKRTPVPPQAAVRPRGGLGAPVSVVERRQSAGVAPPGWIARPAKHVVLRALERLEDGALDVTLPDGTTRRFGRGEPLGVRIAPSTTSSAGSLFAATTGLGEAYVAGDWDADDPARVLELLIRNAEPAASRLPGRGARAGSARRDPIAPRADEPSAAEARHRVALRPRQRLLPSSSSTSR